MSFALTKEQYMAGTKDVTRRLGWEFLKPGELIMGVEKAMGLKPGEKIVRLGASEIVRIWREPLKRMLDEPAYGSEECRREGFPDLTPNQFIEMFCATHKGCTPTMAITRIEFKRVKP